MLRNLNSLAAPRLRPESQFVGNLLVDLYLILPLAGFIGVCDRVYAVCLTACLFVCLSAHLPSAYLVCLSV